MGEITKLVIVRLKKEDCFCLNIKLLWAGLVSVFWTQNKRNVVALCVESESCCLRKTRHKKRHKKLVT